MLTELYIAALLVDEELADQVWYQWANNKVDDEVAMLAWWMIVTDQNVNKYREIYSDFIY